MKAHAVAEQDLVLPDSCDLCQINDTAPFHQVRSCLPDAIIIFVTAYLKYAVDAYELDIFRYIPKSSLDEKLPRALDDVVKRMQSQADKSYLIQTATKIEKISDFNRSLRS